MDKNIFVPSLKFEERTRAFNRVLWGFVGFISLFTVLIFVYPFHLMLCYFFDIESTFFSDNILIMSILALIFVIMSMGIIKFFYMICCSYKIENNKIIKGKIVNYDNVDHEYLEFDTNWILSLAQIIQILYKVVIVSRVNDLIRIIKMILLNMNQNFVENYFDTNSYKKKIYYNPILVKETKYYLIYKCDNNKKLSIPKIYEGMDIKNFKSTEKSLISRIVLRSLIIFLTFLLFSMIDLTNGLIHNDTYISNINNTCSNIQRNLSNYGYELTKTCNFRKVVSNNKFSNITYRIDKNGKIKSIILEIYYNADTYNESELRYIIDSLNAGFSNYEVDIFISQVDSCINGVCSYGKMTNENQILRIGSSEGFINIHNW